MGMFNDKSFKFQLIVLVVTLFLFTLIGQLLVMYATKSYKENILIHDFAIAGYLAQTQLQSSEITQAFTDTKTNEEIIKGQQLLQSTGYNKEIENVLIPEVKAFYYKSAVTSLFLSILLSAIILYIFLYFNAKRNKAIEKANDTIQLFMNGNNSIRLDDNKEGTLSQLFSSINTLSTSLTTHIDKEKYNKEFLKETISDISHQLKTPLAALQMYNEIIQEEDTTNDVINQFLKKSERELNRMAFLIQNLLKLAKLDAGTIILEKKHYTLKPFLEECLVSYYIRAQLEHKFITLQCNNTLNLHFDREWLHEAVGNVIKNALDHISPGGNVNILCDDTPVMTEIIIIDNGSGIHPDDIHHVFKRFYRSRFTSDKHGIGIGLALSKAIIEKHGGTITVESELSKGTSFRLAFPKLTNL